MQANAFADSPILLNQVIQDCSAYSDATNRLDEFFVGNKYRCCMRGFCSQNAFGQMFASFTDEAFNKLLQTAKRRNDGNNLAHSGQTQFVISTAALADSYVTNSFLHDALGIQNLPSCDGKPRALQLTATYSPQSGTWQYGATRLTFRAENSLATYNGQTPALSGSKDLCGMEMQNVNAFACDLCPAAPAQPNSGLFVSFGEPRPTD